METVNGRAFKTFGWLTRDNSGDCYLYIGPNKPIRDEDAEEFCCEDDHEMLYVPSDFIDETITYEKGPVKVELVWEEK